MACSQKRHDYEDDSGGPIWWRDLELYPGEGDADDADHKPWPDNQFDNDKPSPAHRRILLTAPRAPAEAAEASFSAPAMTKFAAGAALKPLLPPM